MRMWGVPTKFLCKKHLLGEHNECHMMIGAVNKSRNVKGFTNGLVDFNKISERHDALVKEMKTRGYNHQSPIKALNNNLSCKPVDVKHNLKELMIRCSNCSKRISELK